MQVKKDFDKNAAAVNFQDEKYVKQVTDKLPDVGKKMEYLLNTGNLISRSGLDLSQAAGFTVVAEKLNFFRCLHATLASQWYIAAQRWRGCKREFRVHAGICRTFGPCTVARTSRNCVQRRCASCCPSRGASCARCTRQMAHHVAC